MEKRVYVYDNANQYQGYVRLDQDEIGHTVGEVYNTQADRLGAIRYEPLNFEAQESLVYDQEGAQIGSVQLEVYENDQIGGDIYWSAEPGATDQSIAHVHFNPNAGENAEVHKKAQWGEILGRLKPENTSEEELVLMGGGAALLLLL